MSAILLHLENSIKAGSWVCGHLSEHQPPGNQETVSHFPSCSCRIQVQAGQMRRPVEKERNHVLSLSASGRGRIVFLRALLHNSDLILCLMM